MTQPMQSFMRYGQVPLEDVEPTAMAAPASLVRSIRAMGVLCPIHEVRGGRYQCLPIQDLVIDRGAR